MALVTLYHSVSLGLSSVSIVKLLMRECYVYISNDDSIGSFVNGFIQDLIVVRALFKCKYYYLRRAFLVD